MKQMKKVITAATLGLLLSIGMPAAAQTTDNNNSTTSTTTRTADDNDDHGKWGLAGLLGLLGLLGRKRNDHTHDTVIRERNTTPR